MKIIGERASVSWSIKRIEFMKGNGLMIRGQAKDLRDIVTVIRMRAIFKLGKLMEKECIPGQMEKCMMVSGPKESKKGTECGEVYLAIATWANGIIAKLMVMVFTSGKTAIVTKAAGKTV